MRKRFVIFPTNEIVSIFLSQSFTRSGTARSKAKVSLRDYLAEDYHLNLGPDVDISAVENSANKMNLTLPYYESLEKAQASILRDNEMDVYGGEIVGTLDSFFRATNLAWEISELITDGDIDISNPYAVNIRMALESVDSGNSALSRLMYSLSQGGFESTADSNS